LNRRDAIFGSRSAATHRVGAGPVGADPEWVGAVVPKEYADLVEFDGDASLSAGDASGCRSAGLGRLAVPPSIALSADRRAAERKPGYCEPDERTSQDIRRPVRAEIDARNRHGGGHAPPDDARGWEQPAGRQRAGEGCGGVAGGEGARRRTLIDEARLDHHLVRTVAID
jgi:hypothetical protein